MVWKWLGPLARDYCTDLVKDSTAALQKLEVLAEAGEVNDTWFSISIDIVSLYDSLKHDLVLKAIEDAIDCCRPDWTPDFRTWFKKLIQLSFDSAVLKNCDQWYEVVNGVPTGGIDSVDCGNITLFYVLKNLIYEKRPSELVNLDRFVDDISGQGRGCADKFREWVESIRLSMVTSYGLDITYDVKPITEFTQFLDIQYRFQGGQLTTDLFRKATDANRYLEFSSFHPRHTFRSIVYSQALRYRRIVNDDELLDVRLKELQMYFERSSYPSDMVTDVIKDVRAKPRSIGYKSKNQQPNVFTPWIITYGAGYEETKKKAKESNIIVSSSRTYSNKSPSKIPKFQVVTRRAPNLKDSLFKRKRLALASSSRATVRCTDPKGKKKRGQSCMTCNIVSGHSVVDNNGHKIQTQGGNCQTNNIIYAATCKLCSKNNVYVGKTILALRSRVNGHRTTFTNILKSAAEGKQPALHAKNDENVLGAHLFTVHHKRDKSDFDRHFVFDILATTSPENLRKCEQSHIDKLNCVYPLGLNNIKSVSGS